MPRDIWQTLSHSRCSITLLTFGKIISQKKCQKKSLETPCQSGYDCKAVWGLRKGKDFLFSITKESSLAHSFGKHFRSICYGPDTVWRPMDTVTQRSGFFFLRGSWGRIHELVALTRGRATGEMCAVLQGLRGHLWMGKSWVGTFSG